MCECQGLPVCRPFAHYRVSYIVNSGTLSSVLDCPAFDTMTFQVCFCSHRQTAHHFVSVSPAVEAHRSKSRNPGTRSRLQGVYLLLAAKSVQNAHGTPSQAATEALHRGLSLLTQADPNIEWATLETGFSETVSSGRSFWFDFLHRGGCDCRVR